MRGARLIRLLAISGGLLLALAITMPLFAARPPANLLDYSPLFSSAGQPNKDYFDVLAKQNFDVVINIATPASKDALKNEGHLVAALGMTYINIPVDWHNPTQKEFRMFQQFMKSNPDSKIFLHCQMNLRASAYAFLHRVINLDEAPDAALADLHRVWIPNKTWADFMNSALEQYKIDFTVPHKSDEHTHTPKE